MTYDGDGLRASKSKDGFQTFYLYDWDTPVVEEGADGSLLAGNGWGPMAGGRGSTRRAAAFDTLTYNGYGQLRGDLDSVSGQAEVYQDPVGFGGQFGYYTDAETGLALLTHRYYDALGRTKLLQLCKHVS